MQKNIWVAGWLILATVCANGKNLKYKISGVMEFSSKEPAAVVNGRMCHVGDTVDGGVISAISVTAVTISENGKQMLYPVGDLSESASGGAIQTEETGWTSWFKKLGRKRNNTPVPVEVDSNEDVAVKLTENETVDKELISKMKSAEQLYVAEQRSFEIFQRDTLSFCKNKSDLAKAANIYNEMVQLSLSKIKELELPQSANSEYDSWISSYVKKLESMRMSNLNEIESVMEVVGCTSERIVMDTNDFLISKE